MLIIYKMDVPNMSDVCITGNPELAIISEPASHDNHKAGDPHD